MMMKLYRSLGLANFEDGSIVVALRNWNLSKGESLSSVSQQLAISAL